MEARQLTLHIQSGRMDAAVQNFTDHVLPAIEHAPGLQHILVLTDAAGQMQITTLWATPAHRQATHESGLLHEQIGKFAAQYAGEPQLTHYTVALHR